MKQQTKLPAADSPAPSVVEAVSAADSPLERAKRAVWALVSHRLPIVQTLVLVAVFVIASLTMRGFTAWPSLRATLVIACLLALAALGQTLVILVGGLDMAVPGYLAVGAISAVVLPSDHGWSLLPVAAFVVVVTALAGALTGVICHVLHVQPLVVSLGVSAMLTGGALFLTNAEFMGAPPPELTALASTTSTTFGLPIPPVVSITIVALVGVGLLLSRTVGGRRLYAIGANPTAARGIHIPTGAIWTATFALSAAFTGLTGMLVAGFSGGANLAIGEPYFFTGLAAILIGGTALGSARGDFTRTIIGALTLTILTTILTGMGLQDGDRRVLYGLMIISVVLVYARERRLRDLL